VLSLTNSAIPLFPLRRGGLAPERGWGMSVRDESVTTQFRRKRYEAAITLA